MTLPDYNYQMTLPDYNYLMTLLDCQFRLLHQVVFY